MELRAERKREEEKKEEGRKMTWSGKLRRIAVVQGGVRMKMEATITQVAAPNPRVITRAVGKDPLQVFLRVLPIEVWDHVCEMTNNRMDEKVRMQEVIGDYARKYYRALVSMGKLLHIFGTRMIRALETKKKLRIAGEKRMSAVLSALSCDWPVFIDLLRTNWKQCIIPSEVFVVDESMFSYQPRGEQKRDCPKRYIPRKPHPNGLLCYFATFKTRCNNPYSFDLTHDLMRENPLSPRAVIQEIGARWDWN